MAEGGVLAGALGGFALGDLVARVRMDTSDLDRAQGEADGFGSKLKGAFAIGTAAVAAGTAGIAEFAKSSIDKFKDVGAETNQLIRLTGGSAEEMSRLRFAAQETGVSTDALGGAIRRLSTGIESNNQNIVDSGIAFRDAHGQILPMDQLLGNVADRFQSLPNGIEKNALAVQLFGRSGTELLPFLNKGRDGLAALEQQADKFGLTLTKSNLDALSKNKAAHKEFSAAVEGLQVQFGVHLLPTINQFIELGTKYLLPVITETTHVLDAVLTPVLAGVGRLFDVVVGPAIRSVADFVDGEGTEVWRVLTSLFKTDVQPVLESVASFLSGTLTSAWSGIRNVVQDDVAPALSGLVDTAKTEVFPALQGVGQWVRDHFGPLFSSGLAAAKEATTDVWSFVTKTALPGIQSAIQSFADGFLANIGPSLSTIWDGAKVALQGFWDLVQTVLPDIERAAGFVGNAFSAVTGFLGIGGSGKNGSNGSNGTSGRDASGAPGAATPAAGGGVAKEAGSLLGSVGGIVGGAGLITGLLGAKDPLKDITSGVKELTTTSLGKFLDDTKGKISGLVPDFVRFGGAAEGAGAGLSLLSLPVGAIVVGIAALAAGAIYAYTHFKTFHDVVDNVASAIAGAFSTAVNWVVEHWPQISATVSQVFEDISAVAVPILQAAADLINGIVGSVTDFFDSHWSEISEITRVAFELIKVNVEVTLAVVGAIVFTALSVIQTGWHLFHDDILNVVKGVWEVISAVIQTAINIVLDYIGIGLDLITGHWGKAWDDVKKLLSDVWDGMKGVVQGAFDIIQGIFGAQLQVIETLWSAAWNGIKSFFGNVWDGIKLVVTGGIDAVVGFFRGIPGKILGALPNPGGLLTSVGTEIVNGLKQGIEDSWHFVTDKVKDLVNLIPKGVRNLLGISSPSKVFMDIGKEVPAGFAIGIDSGADRVHRSVANLAQIPQISAGSLGTYGAAGGSSSTSTVTRNYTIQTYGTDLDPNEIGATLRRMELAYG